MQKIQFVWCFLHFFIIECFLLNNSLFKFIIMFSIFMSFFKRFFVYALMILDEGEEKNALCGGIFYQKIL